MYGYIKKNTRALNIHVYVYVYIFIDRGKNKNINTLLYSNIGENRKALQILSHKGILQL